MANVLDIAGVVSRNLDDTGASFFNLNSDIIPSIQDGYNYIAALTESIEKSADVSFVSDLVIYDMPAYIPDYLRIFGIFNNNTNRWMYPTTLLELFQIRDNWELAEGQPYLFLPIDYRHVAFFPTLSSASGNMTIIYKAKADTLSSNSVPQIPEEQTNALEHYTTADLLTQCEEFAKAIRWSQDSDKGIEAIRKVLRERSSPNHLYYKHEGY